MFTETVFARRLKMTVGETSRWASGWELGRLWANIINGDANFELKLKAALITMVQASSFCGKAHEDVNAHLQHFLEIYTTFTIKGVT
jgi:hypothetical protein